MAFKCEAEQVAEFGESLGRVPEILAEMYLERFAITVLPDRMRGGGVSGEAWQEWKSE